MDLWTRDIEDVSSIEIFHHVRLNDDVITKLIIAQSMENDEGVINEVLLLGQAITNSTRIQRLEIKLHSEINLELWRLLAEGMAGNQSIIWFSIFVLEQNATGLNSLLQCFGPFLEKNLNLEFIEILTHFHVMTGHEMKMISTPLSKKSRPLEMFEIVCVQVDDEIIRELVTAFSQNPRVTPKCISFPPFMMEVAVGMEGVEYLVHLLESPDCSLEQLFVEVEIVDENLVCRLADVLRKNNTLKEIKLHPTVERRIPDAEWRQLENVLCDDTSVITTYNSNHAVESIILENKYGLLPSYIQCNLNLNTNINKTLVARRKVFTTHLAGNKICGGSLNKMESMLLIHVVAFVDRVIEENGGDVELLSFGHNLRFTFLYQLLKSYPVLFGI